MNEGTVGPWWRFLGHVKTLLCLSNFEASNASLFAAAAVESRLFLCCGLSWWANRSELIKSDVSPDVRIHAVTDTDGSVGGKSMESTILSAVVLSVSLSPTRRTRTDSHFISTLYCSGVLLSLSDVFQPLWRAASRLFTAGCGCDFLSL